MTRPSHPPPQAAESDLPEGWFQTAVDQLLASLESGSRPRGGVRGISEGKPSIGGEHLNDEGGFRFDNIKYVPEPFYRGMLRGRIQVGDVLVVKDGATTGKVSLVRPEFPYPEAVVNEHVFVCRPAAGVVPAFLFWYLFSKEGQVRILENFQGSAQGGINQSFAPGTSVPVAPSTEQKRIVAKVEELLGRVNAARGRLAKAPAILKRFRQSVLAAACSGRLTEDWRRNHLDENAEHLLASVQSKAMRKCEVDYEIPESWAAAPCGSLCRCDRALTYGVIKLGPPHESGVPTLRSSDVRSLCIDESSIKRISPEIAAQYNRTFLEGGEIVVTVRGTLGGVALVPPHMKGYNVSREVAVIPVHPTLNAAFFASAIASIRSQNWLTDVEKGVAYTGINIEDLKRLPLPVPPLAEQREIVRLVEKLFALADAIERRVSAATARAERLTQAILAKAFRGELVPTEAEIARAEGRAYESAAELLVRIRSSTEGPSTSPRTTRSGRRNPARTRRRIQ